VKIYRNSSKILEAIIPLKEDSNISDLLSQISAILRIPKIQDYKLFNFKGNELTSKEELKYLPNNSLIFYAKKGLMRKKKNLIQHLA